MALTPTTQIYQAIVDQTIATNNNNVNIDGKEMICCDLETGELH